jgi:hypothetical protein
VVESRSIRDVGHLTVTRRSGTAALAAEWTAALGRLDAGRLSRRSKTSSRARVACRLSLGATRHANFCTIGQPDGLQVGSRMPICVLRNDISGEWKCMSTEHVRRTGCVAQSKPNKKKKQLNRLDPLLDRLLPAAVGKTCPICTSYRALINCRLHIRDEPVGNLGKKSTRSYAVANHSCWTRGNMSSAVGSYSSFGIRL